VPPHTRRRYHRELAGPFADRRRGVVGIDAAEDHEIRGGEAYRQFHGIAIARV
jgi:hypothetical protein